MKVWISAFFFFINVSITVDNWPINHILKPQRTLAHTLHGIVIMRRVHV